MTAPGASAADLLATIVAATRRVVEARQARESLAALERRAGQVETRPGRFRRALEGPFPRIIAECKRRSPLRGVLRREYDPADIARSYEAAGAAAISVLTEPTFFDGALAHLEAVRAAIHIPVLRKDFVVSDYQLLEARAAGADAVLLIAAALDGPELRTLIRQADALGLDALVEVHRHDELSAAADAGAAIIGVNNRDLRTLAVDVAASEALAAAMPAGVLRVSESGLKSASDLSRLRAHGYGAFLIGERFMTQADPGRELARLMDVVEGRRCS
jgi:indole-3-glycerol phosphate synthase